MKKFLVVLVAGGGILGTILLVVLGFMDIYMNGFSFLEAKYNESHDVFGIYLTDEGSAKIQIRDCGDGTPCGRFVWFNPESLPYGETMETFTGVNGKPLLGSLILKGFTRERTDWRGGTVYDSDNVKTYYAHLNECRMERCELEGALAPSATHKFGQKLPSRGVVTLSLVNCIFLVRLSRRGEITPWNIAW